jgi:hypothetical protein
MKKAEMFYREIEAERGRPLSGCSVDVLVLMASFDNVDARVMIDWCDLSVQQLAACLHQQPAGSQSKKG